MNINDTVKLITFDGEKSPTESIDPEYNYWKLINNEGIIFEIRNEHPYYPEKGPQALVKFNSDLSEIGLASHNVIPNSLWIFISDLKKIK